MTGMEKTGVRLIGRLLADKSATRSVTENRRQVRSTPCIDYRGEAPRTKVHCQMHMSQDAICYQCLHLLLGCDSIAISMSCFERPYGTASSTKS